jgi:hypothetical protein
MDATTPQTVAVIEHELVSEQSGIARSQRYEGVYWVLNDSGSAPALFAVQLDGSVVAPPWLRGEYTFGPEPRGKKQGKPLWPGLVLEGASNLDWEDLTTDGDRLYVADVGNNGNARRDLGIYVLPEPNPAAVDRARPLLFLPVAYPAQQAWPPEEWRFDCEAVFWFRDHLYLVTKHRRDATIDKPDVSADLYRLDTQHTDEINLLTHVDHIEDLGGWVTAAAMSPDGARLAVLVQAPAAALWVFDAPPVGDAFFSDPGTELPLAGVQQAEGVTWQDDQHVLVTNEQRQILRLQVAR